MICGKPGEWLEDGDTLGCWCILEVAAQDKEKKCWLRAQGINQGWYD